MIKSSLSLSQVKETIKKMQQKTVDVTLNLGRNKFVSFSGTLVGVYPALFTVMPFDKNFKGKTSYSYSEYMCGRVRLKESAPDA
ncbi:MAG: Veg family protein [Clostridia bacterium]|nr:Veg family protein [Clostridia bacterium]MBR2448659.1 Veg family protein [Clostridia bacterium]